MPTTPGLIRAKQTERLVAALIPPVRTASPAAPVSEGQVVLPALGPGPTRHQHRVVLIDDHGRLREASLFSALDWSPSTRVGFEERGESLLVRANPRGAQCLDPKGRLRIPGALRKFRGWSAGSTVLLSVPTDESVLVLTPTSVLDNLVVLHAC